MKKLLFLSSALLMTMAGAHSADLVEGAITGGANTCTVDVLKVYENNAIANTIATWSPVTYTCTPGQYLLQTETSVECTECPVGSYCPGGEFTVETNTSITQCPDTYTSDTGATGENECYIGCELACSTNVECPPHSKNCVHSAFTTTGRQYVDATCNAYPSVCPIADFSCDVGYNKTTMTSSYIQQEMIHKVLNPNGNKLSVLSCGFDNKDETDGTHPFVIGDGIIPDNSINDCDFLKPGQVAYLFGLGTYALVTEFSLNDYNYDTVSGVQSVRFPEGGCVGDGCTFISVKYLENANFSSESTGEYLWGTLKYIALPNEKTKIIEDIVIEYVTNGSISPEASVILQQILPQNALMVLQNLLQNGDALNADQLIAALSAMFFSTMNKIDTNLPWTDTPLKRLQEENASITEISNFYFVVGPRWDLVSPDTTVSACTNNIININWNPDNGTPAIENMCYYDGAITLPDTPTKPGYTFSGWKLVE